MSGCRAVVTQRCIDFPQGDFTDIPRSIVVLSINLSMIVIVCCHEFVPYLTVSSASHVVSHIFASVMIWKAVAMPDFHL